MIEKAKNALRKTNDHLAGFRTILTAVAGFLLVFADSFFGVLAGFNHDAVKGAAVVAGLVTLKQIKTAVIPRLQAILKK